MISTIYPFIHSTYLRQNSKNFQELMGKANKFMATYRDISVFYNCSKNFLEEC